MSAASSSHPTTLDALFGSANDSLSLTAAERQSPGAPQPPHSVGIVNEDAAAGLTTSFETRQTHHEVPSSSLLPIACFLRGDREHGSYESGESATSLRRRMQQSSVEYSAVPVAASREPTCASYSIAASTSSRTSASGDHILSLTGSTVNRMPGANTSPSPFSDLAGEEAADPHSEENNTFTSLALLQRFLEEREHVAAERRNDHLGWPPSKAAPPSASHSSQVFDTLRIAQLVPSVIPAATAVEGNTETPSAAKLDQAPYLTDITYMRASTVTTVLKRQKAERHAAYSGARLIFRSRTPLADTAAIAGPTHLPAVLEMPLRLRCAMCQLHDSVCCRCHSRWSRLQETYRTKAAVHCYSTLDIHKRGPLGLLTAAMGTGAFLEMMSIADGLRLPQTRVRVTPASLDLLLKSCGRVLSAAIKDRLTRAEDDTLPSRGMWLKVAHIGCLFGHRDVLRSLWLLCPGGCSHAAQITTQGLHALELLPKPYEPALVAVLNQCSTLREYLLWARIMQCLSVKAVGSDAEATQLCAELRRTGSWVGVWSEALLAYVKGDRDRCVELCDELLCANEPQTSAGEGEIQSTAMQADLALGASAMSFSSSAMDTGNRAPPPPSASSSMVATAPSVSTMRPVMNWGRIRALKELALGRAEPWPRLEATEEEAPKPVPVASRVSRVDETVSEQQAKLSRRTVVHVPLRRLPFSVVRRVLSYCDASALLSVYGATRIPLLQWISLARIKCLPAKQWTRLLTSNVGYTPLMESLCKFVPPPVLSREDREAQQEEAAAAAAAGLKSSSREPTEDRETRAVEAASMASPPFQPLHMTVVDIDDLSHLAVKAVTLAYKTVQGDTIPGEPLTVDQWLLHRLFGRATSLISTSKYLVLSRVYRLTAPDAESNLVNADVSKWASEAIQPWEVDVDATMRWCTYVQRYADAARLL
ncbi:hypothetical protein ABL78_0291 [Leptomonas seymouri]|uniref:F-box domain-containing protein n=1 Tax=Leptomonas seymouri TaxID=5684 RepID=A0A0N1IAE4_LEPSE|nr:hypothetical protein ABL78_0291 [Leptomonas seymouri]|eukprot:KPI90531.1 hypothetical protein ABL78_0291 [Leptomonas seymouri]